MVGEGDSAETPDSPRLDGAVGFHNDRASSWSSAYRHSGHFRRRAFDWQAVIDANIDREMRVLDAGCGAGDLSLIATRRGAVLTCVDASPAMVAEARHALSGQSPSPSFHQADIRHLPVPDGSFDAVIASSVLEYIAPLDAALKEFRRVLAAGGMLLCSLPNRQSIYRRIEGLAVRLTGRPAYRRHVNEDVYRTDLDRLFDHAGFEIIDRRPSGTPPLLGRGVVGDFAERHARLATLTLFVARAV